MQTGGDQQAVEEGVQTGANAAQADDAVAQHNQQVEDDGPDKQQDDGNHDGNQTGHNGNAALAAEEGQPVRQLDALELVVAGGTDDGSQDADEGVAGDLAERDVVDAALFQGADGTHHSGAQQLGHHQVADQARQTRGAVMVIGQAHGSAHSEQPGHIVDQGAAGLDQDETGRVSKAGGGAFSTHGGRSQRVAQAHENAADRKRGDRQHQCLAELLQILHHKSIPPKYRWIPLTGRQSFWFLRLHTLLFLY